MEDFRKFDKRRLERVSRWLKELRAWRNARVSPVSAWEFTGADGVATPLQLGDAWPSVDTPVTLSATAVIPQDWAGQEVEIELWLGGEGFVKFTPGEQTGLNPFHHDFVIAKSAKGGESIRINAEVVPKGMFGAHVGNPAISRAHLTIPQREVRALETDLRNIIGAAEQLKDHEILPHLLDLVDAAYRELVPDWPTSTDIAKVRYISGDTAGGNSLDIGLGDYGMAAFEGNLLLSGIWNIPPADGVLEPLPEAAIDATRRARTVIAKGLDRLREDYPPVGRLMLTGHAHIDLAWLWPVAETRRKVRRTFSSVLRLMDQYDDFTFNQSSAQAYAWIAEDDPALLERIKERVKEGRWEPVGGSWLEPDSQVTGGEAYVRQLFYGQRLFQEFFGIRNETAWLPDVFGFSGGVPQILRGAGISRFFTIKVTWSEANAFPYDLFTWEGIDGSTVVAHTFFNPALGYNGNIAPADTFGTWKNFVGKRYHNETMLSFGWGDGGGGPSEDMLENYARIREFPALPRLRMGKVEEFFASLPTEGIPTYVGELYLELHRATLTTQGLVKRLNREAEHRLVEAETFATIAYLDGAVYPHEEIDGAWKKLLLNQFHDILPGSSIHEVYEDSHQSLSEAVATATTVRDNALGATSGETIMVTNPSPWPRPLSVTTPDGTFIHDARTLIDGFATIALPANAPAASNPVTADRTKDGGYILENSLLQVEIGADGTLHGVFDKEHQRETLSDRANQLWAYMDRPRAWDAWDIDETYEIAGEEITSVASIELLNSGDHRASVRVIRNWRSSRFAQTYHLTADSRRVDIEYDIDWHERLMLVRAQFPTTIHAHEATFETMFGVQRRANHRNTSFERARFEVGAHRFVDLSEPDYGVALLNNAKYGHSAVGGVLGVSLVRGPLFPDPFADEGEHHFTLSLFPHPGDWTEGGVVREAQALNAPLLVTSGSAAQERPGFLTLGGQDLGFATMKRAHDVDGVILRFYEPHGNRGTSTIAFARDITSAKRVNLLEEDDESATLTLDGNTVTLNVRPFELISMLVVFA